MTQLIAAVRLAATGATKQEAIERGFNVKKGGTASYARAKQLYDLAMEVGTAPASEEIAA